jgi:ABC-type antimicrobial peptide transport system permease subunit
MFRYAVKRIIRGRSLFLSLFLSVALAVTLFSGILQGADAVGVALLDKTLDSAYVDIISSAPDKNLTKTRYYEIDEIFGEIEGVASVDHFIRWKFEVNSPLLNESLETAVLALPPDSSLFNGISGIDEFEDGKLYIDASSENSAELIASEQLEIAFVTYMPFNPPGFENRTFTKEVGGFIGLEQRAFLIGTGRYNIYLRDLIQGREEMGRRPSYDLILMSEETLLSIINPILEEMRRPVDDQATEALVRLERNNLINPWDIEGSKERVGLILEDVNTAGAEYYYTPRSYLTEILNTISSLSNQMKTSTILVALPVFFTAWYLGDTVSEVVYALRKREIGLFFTRGMTHRQVLYLLLFEGILIGLIAAITGIFVGALLLVVVIPEMSFLQVFNSISILTVVSSLFFSMLISVLSAYRPARRAINVNVVDALREYETETESLGEWQLALISFILGEYKMGMLLAGLTVEQFRPESGNLIVNLLYNTWWGTDYILSFIAPILFLWGFVNLFLILVPGFQTILGKVAGIFVGESSKFTALSSRRNIRKTAAATFMVALIIGYSTTVIGNVSSTNDFMTQAVRLSIGADASIWLFEGEDLPSLGKRIATIPGVEALANETHFSPESSIGDTPIRAIDPSDWKEVAYIDEKWLNNSESILQAMADDPAGGIMEKGAAERLGIDEGDILMVKLRTKLFPINIVGLFGKEPTEYWIKQNPTVYVNEEFLENVRKKTIEKRRILVDLAPGINLEEFKTAVENLDWDIERVDVTELQIDKSLSNIYLAGPRRIEELGSYMAGLVASVGVALIISTLMRSRNKELTIMAIRGYSPRQLSTTILVENLGMDVFAIILGIIVGYINLRGQTELFNQLLGVSIERRIVFPLSAELNLLLIIGLLIVATIIPILITINRISGQPDLKLEE